MTANPVPFVRLGLFDFASASWPRPREMPDATGVSEGDDRRHDNQQWDGAERNEPENPMAGLIRASRVDAVLGERGLVERDMDEQEDERADAEPDDAGTAALARSHETQHQEDREHDPRWGNPLDDPRGHSKAEAENSKCQQRTLRERHEPSIPNGGRRVERFSWTRVAFPPKSDSGAPRAQ